MQTSAYDLDNDCNRIIKWVIGQLLVNQMVDSEEPYRQRIASLKQYTHRIRQHIAPHSVNSISKKSQRHTKIPQSPSISLQQAERTRLQQEKQRLKQQISQKIKILCIAQHQKGENAAGSVRMFSSRAPIIQKLQRLRELVSQFQWEQYRLLVNREGIGLSHADTLKIQIIQFLTKHMDCIKLKTIHQRNYVLKFNSNIEAEKWFIFIKLATKRDHYVCFQKWKFTKIICTQPAQKSIKKQQPIEDTTKDILNNILQQLKQKPKEEQKPNFKTKMKSKEISRKQSIENSSFFLSNSSQSNNNNEEQNLRHHNMLVLPQKKKKKSAEEQSEVVKSFQFETVDEAKQTKQIKSMMMSMKSQLQRAESQVFKVDLQANNPDQNIQQFSPKLEKSQSMLMTMKLLTKLQQKKKLLSDSSNAMLGIHWHEQPLSNQMQNQFESQHSSPQRYIPSPKDLNFYAVKQSSSSVKKIDRSTVQQSPIKIKRVQSYTREKSDSRQSDNEHLRKNTNFSLQVEKVENDRKKSSKNQIRDHYLQRLMEKQAIKQISKSSSKGSQIKLEIANNALLIPQKKTPSMVSNYGSFHNLPQASMIQDSLSQDSRESTEHQIEVQQLKNGIALQKCSKDAWNIKLKRVYISNPMTELCYCDIHNSQDQKKYYIRDIKSIEYGQVTRGILKHKKKRCQEGRCLLIKIDNNGKQKLLQFYLEESEPIQNLQDFAKKLHNFVEQQNQISISETD